MAASHQVLWMVAKYISHQPRNPGIGLCQAKMDPFGGEFKRKAPNILRRRRVDTRPHVMIDACAFAK